MTIEELFAKLEKYPRHFAVKLLVADIMEGGNVVQDVTVVEAHDGQEAVLLYDEEKVC